ncbi:unnamed protein product [Peronospora destructor]|uniref:Protein kinase domain-containing protein n=1 Tax=Peronospora destructor TaxID=86335 RepID=A0AAV0UFH7_9STRA|nr:unnamed protein product [Peronospora destructor]
MVDSVTIGASVAVRRVREPEQGVYEYLEEQYVLDASSEKTVVLPVRLKGWLWRQEGLGIFRRYRRRFCVFKAQQATLDVYSDEENEHGKLLRHLILTRVTLKSRIDRIFVVQGYQEDQKPNQISDSMTRRALTSWRRLLVGDIPSFDRREESFKAVSAKACSVWTHCFKYYMKSYGLRKQKAMQKEEHEENVHTLTGDGKKTEEKMIMDPNFVFEDTSKFRKEMLAAGACGEVWRAIHRSQEVVVKSLLQQVTTGAKSPPSIRWSDGRRRAILGFIEEIRIISRLEHGRIVEFRGVALSRERNLHLVMEYLPRGDLKTFLSTIRRKENSCSGSNSGFQSVWTWTKYQWRLAINIIEGLVYLHSLNPPLVHGDLKSANILLRSDLRAKLTDFGLSRYLLSDEDKDTELAGNDESNASSSRYGSRAYGTGRWMAPELIKGGAQSSIASDVERNQRLVPSDESSSDDSDFRSMKESALVRKIVADSWKPSFRVTCPEVIKKLAHDCLLPDPSKRPTSLTVAYRLRQAAHKRNRPESLAAQAKAITSLYIY